MQKSTDFRIRPIRCFFVLVSAVVFSIASGAGHTTAVSEVCDSERLETWVGTPALDRIEIRLVLRSREVVESLEFDVVCGFGKKQLIPPISVAMFNRDGNKRVISASQYAWEQGCATYPEIVTNSGRSWIAAFSERGGRAWRRIDRQSLVGEVSEASWRSMTDSLDKYYRDFVYQWPRSPVAEMTLGNRTRRIVRRLSGTPQLKAVSVIVEMHPKATDKSAKRSFLGVARVIASDEKSSPFINSEASWSTAFAVHLDVKSAREADPFLGEYTNGDYRLVLLGDYEDLTAVSLGREQKILAQGRSAVPNCD